jgi:hypothetical protein
MLGVSAVLMRKYILEEVIWEEVFALRTGMLLFSLMTVTVVGFHMIYCILKCAQPNSVIFNLCGPSPTGTLRKKAVDTITSKINLKVKSEGPYTHSQESLHRSQVHTN